MCDIIETLESIQKMCTSISCEHCPFYDWDRCLLKNQPYTWDLMKLKEEYEK